MAIVVHSTVQSTVTIGRQRLPSTVNNSQWRPLAAIGRGSRMVFNGQESGTALIGHHQPKKIPPATNVFRRLRMLTNFYE